MKPSIINWAYIGLASILLNKIIGTVQYTYNSSLGFFYEVAVVPPHFDFYTALLGNGGMEREHIPIFSTVVLIVAAASVFGLVKRASWARVVTFSIVGIEGFILLAIVMVVTVYDLPISTRQIGSSLVFGVPLLFLAYKIYTSEPLKIYLSRPPHAAP